MMRRQHGQAASPLLQFRFRQRPIELDRIWPSRHTGTEYHLHVRRLFACQFALIPDLPLS